jgi:hypothetical protein
VSVGTTNRSYLPWRWTKPPRNIASLISVFTVSE